MMCGYSYTGYQDFKRPLDEMLDWWFGIVPLVLAETYIQIQRYRERKAKAKEAALFEFEPINC